MDYRKGLVSAVIVTFNQRKCLERCVRSLLRQSYPYLEIIIINNGRDAYLDSLRVEFSSVKVINNKENLFYSGAQNQGIKVSTGEFLLCLNDDVVLEGDFIKEALKGFDIDHKVGMVSGKILRMDKITIDSTGLFLGKSRKPVERGFNQKDRGQYNKEGYIFGVSGAAAFYRRTMLEDTKDENGYFDQRYGMFYEDLDLAWRANKKGWRAYYTPEAVAYHKRGESAKVVIPKIKLLKKYNFACLNDELKIMLIKNRYRTIIKNDSFLKVMLNLPFILAYEIELYLYITLFSPRLLLQILKR